MVGRVVFHNQLKIEFNSGLDISDSLGRGPAKPMDGGSDEWGRRTTSTFKVVGRHVLNVWRLMRSELSLTSYTFENVCFYLLHRR